MLVLVEEGTLTWSLSSAVRVVLDRAYKVVPRIAVQRQAVL